MTNEQEQYDSIKREFEADLFLFTYYVLGRTYLYGKLHNDICKWLTTIPFMDGGRPKFRKMLLLPREHCKTSLVSHALPCHILIQRPESNLYCPGVDGRNTRILLAGETLDRASKNLKVVQSIFESNELFRKLWPEHTFNTPAYRTKDPRRESKRWNANEMEIPRNINYPDPSVQAIGVGGAITGARFDVSIKDDLVSVEAANSAIVMDAALTWHKASRALMESAASPEYIIGTRWAVHDIYDEIEQNDETVTIIKRSVVEDGEVIYPTKFSLQPEYGKHSIDQLHKEHGIMFYLLYMNSAADPELVDFDIEQLRYYAMSGDAIVFEESDVDAKIMDKLNAPAPEMPDVPSGTRLTAETYDILRARGEYLRFRAK